MDWLFSDDMFDKVCEERFRRFGGEAFDVHKIQSAWIDGSL